MSAELRMCVHYPDGTVTSYKWAPNCVRDARAEAAKSGGRMLLGVYFTSPDGKIEERLDFDLTNGREVDIVPRIAKPGPTK